MPSAEQPLRPHGPDASGEAPSLSLQLYLLPLDYKSSSSDSSVAPLPGTMATKVLACASLSPPLLRLPPPPQI